MVAGALCFFFAFVPGFPTGIFITLGLVLLISGAMLIPAFRLIMRSYSTPAFDTVFQRKAEMRVSAVSNTATVAVEDTSPFVLKLPNALSKNGGDTEIQNEMQQLLKAHRAQTGVALPQLNFVWLVDGNSRWSLEVFDVPVIAGDSASIDDISEICSSGMLAVRKNINLFFGLEQSNRLLNQASESSPEVVKEVQRALSSQSISLILRNLVEEEVPIKNLSGALEALASASVNEKDLQNLTEYARISLGRQLCHKYAREGVIEAIGLSLTLEEELLNLMRDNSHTAELGASPQFAERVTTALRDAIQTLQPAVIVVPVVLRRQIRLLIADSCFETPVLSYPEIVKPFSLKLLSRVELNDSGDSTS